VATVFTIVSPWRPSDGAEGARDQQDAGLTPTDIDAVSAGRVIIAGGERAFFDHITVGDPGDDAALARDLALTWWHGIYRRPAVSGIP